jgi:hypothetical protein
MLDCLCFGIVGIGRGLLILKVYTQNVYNEEQE